MKTLAEFKRAMREGTKVRVTNHVFSALTGDREVIRTQTKQWCLSFPEGHPKAAPGEGSWLDIPKASMCTIDGDTLTITRDEAWGDDGPFCTITVLPT